MDFFLGVKQMHDLTLFTVRIWKKIGEEMESGIPGERVKGKC